MSNMTCAEARALVQLRMDGPLDAARAVDVERHLGGCAACREHADELRALRESLRELPLLEFPEAALDELFERTLGPERLAHPSWTGVRWLAAAAALLLAALLLPWLAFGPAGGPAAPAYTDAELRIAKREVQAVLGITGRAIERGGTLGVTRALEEGVAPALGSTGARLTGRILERQVAPPLERLPLLSSTPIRSAAPRGGRSR